MHLGLKTNALGFFLYQWSEAPASHRNLVEIHVIEPHSRSTKSATQEAGPTNVHFTSPLLGDSEALLMFDNYCSESL